MITPRPAAPQAGFSAAACRRYLDDLQRFGIKLGLGNMRTLLDALDNPHLAYSCIHVAGTNGKGSVCAMLAEILQRSGLRVGLYTSPHLVRVEERIRIDGRLIPGTAFRRIIGTLKAGIDDLLARKKLESSPTFFEVLTAAALLHFRDRKVDCAILEVGMGGRFDATNVITPVVSVITNIARDHVQYLGNTLAEIAFEKAGIIKPGVPVVSGVSGRAALAVIRRRAQEEKAPLIEVFGRETRLEPGSPNLGSYRLSPALPGAHQVRNAAVAAATADFLQRQGWPVGRKTIEEGIRTARWEGRLEQIGRRPRVFLDGAHNEAGASALAAFIDENCPRPPVLVFAMMKDKAIGRVTRILFPRASKIILTTIPYPRAAVPRAIRTKAARFSPEILLEPDPSRALGLARRLAGPKGTVIVTGSLFLVGAIKKASLFFDRTVC